MTEWYTISKTLTLFSMKLLLKTMPFYPWYDRRHPVEEHSGATILPSASVLALIFFFLDSAHHPHRSYGSCSSRFTGCGSVQEFGSGLPPTSHVRPLAFVVCLATGTVYQDQARVSWIMREGVNYWRRKRCDSIDQSCFSNLIKPWWLWTNRGQLYLESCIDGERKKRGALGSCPVLVRSSPEQSGWMTT